MSKIGRPNIINEINRGLILHLVREEGPISRAKIARKLGLSRPTVSAHVQDLIKEGLVLEVGKGETKKGRKDILLVYNAKHGYILAGDLEGSFFRLAISDMSGKIEYEEVIKTQELREKNLMYPQNFPIILKKILEKNGIQGENLKILSFGITGIIDEGRLMLSPGLPEWNNAPLGKILEEEFPSSLVILERDVNMAVLGEYWKGAGRGKENIVYITISTGIGAGIIINGKIYEGKNKFAGEIGYMSIDDPNYIYPGVLNTPFGSLEWNSSWSGIQKRLQQLGKSYKTIEEIFENYEKDKELKEIIDISAENLARAIVNVTTVLAPEIIIIGGILGRYLDILLPKMEKIFEHYLPIDINIVSSPLGNNAVIWGSIYKALNIYHSCPVIV
ncbi:MAG: ROK family transcriptional regulator [Dictyoglomus sp.]|nr:ROK family transcriptional regulator [Dictyoglomus sp.]MDW8187902.1 ROK family transcriptional regulator [Dictyoglomus sp.]